MSAKDWGKSPETSVVPATACPGCGHPLDRVTGPRQVRPSDVSICINCAVVLQFDSNRVPRAMSTKAMLELEPAHLDRVNEVRSAVLRSRIFG